VITIALAIYYYNENSNHELTLCSMSDTPFETDTRISLGENTNRLFTGYEDVDFICISMETRKARHFERLKAMLAKDAIKLTWFKGIDGKKVNMDDYNMSKRYRSFFENNIKEREAGKTTTDYRGHLGCTLAHLGAISSIKNMTVIFEDDAEVVPNFRQKFQTAIGAVTQVDPDWEILLLGWCCNYNDHFYCKGNDTEPIHEGGVVKVHYWIGGWAYCIRNAAVATKILKLFNPMTWHIDLTLAEAARTNQLRVYACVPTIANHAGWLRISSYDFYQKGDPSFIKTDTNS
jgi:GR25 family glycosyltransferase involved in LPS biosynthesis